MTANIERLALCLTAPPQQFSRELVTLVMPYQPRRAPFLLQLYMLGPLDGITIPTLCRRVPHLRRAPFARLRWEQRSPPLRSLYGCPIFARSWQMWETVPSTSEESLLLHLFLECHAERSEAPLQSPAPPKVTHQNARLENP
jgi:hypothetical protein